MYEHKRIDEYLPGGNASDDDRAASDYQLYDCKKQRAV
jgi:hypothetical protein